MIGLTWAASGTTTNVFGYDVYRAIGDGAYTKLNIVPITGTAYDDTSTVDGTSYRYVVRTLSTGAPPLASVDSPIEAVAADARPTTIQSVTPAAGATGVAQNTTVRATFDEPMNAATINSSTFQLRNPSGALVGATVTYNATTRVATLTPTAKLAVGATYQATVKGGPSGVADEAGNRNRVGLHVVVHAPRIPYSIAPGTAVQPGRRRGSRRATRTHCSSTSAWCPRHGRSRTSSRSRTRAAPRCRSASPRSPSGRSVHPLRFQRQLLGDPRQRRLDERHRGDFLDRRRLRLGLDPADDDGDERDDEVVPGADP